MIQELLKRAMKQERSLRAITGLSRRQFHELVLLFHEVLVSKAFNKPRKRKVGGGRRGVLSETRKKVLFILFYLKVYPTCDLAGLLFQVDRSQPCRWVKTLFPILESALGRSLNLPERKIRSVEEFSRVFQDAANIMIDVTERR